MKTADVFHVLSIRSWCTKTASPCAHDSNDPQNHTDSDTTHVDCESTYSSSTSDFEPSGLGDAPFVPQNDFMNSDAADDPNSDNSDNDDDDS